MASSKPAPRRRSFVLEGIDKQERSATFVATTSNPVRAEDGVLEVLNSNWRLERYSKNNIVLRDHEVSKPIGTGQQLEVTPDGLRVRIFFASERTGQIAEETWQSVVEGIVKGASVRWAPGPTTMETRDGQTVRVIDSPELLEISLTALPADEDALLEDDDEAPPSSRPDPSQGSELRSYEREGCKGCAQRSKLTAAHGADACMMEQVASSKDERSAAKSCRAFAATPGPADNEPDADDDDKARQRSLIVAAARLLRSARARKAPPAPGAPQPRLDDRDLKPGKVVLHLDGPRGRLGKTERTALGGARINSAVLSKTGVLSYRQADGSVRRELRLASEVTKSLDSLRGAPIVVGHPYELGGLLDAQTFSAYTKGHAERATLDEKPQANGEQLLRGPLVVQDAATLDAIDSGALDGISLGYTSRLEPSPGVWNGQPYDVIQRDITNNHVALLKPGGGRVDVAGLRLDASDADVCVECTEKDTMTIKMIRLDDKDYEFGSQAHLDAIDAIHKVRITTLTAELDTTKRKVDEIQGRFDAADSEVKKLKGELTAAKDPNALATAVNARVALLVGAGRVLGDDVKLDGLSEREIMLRVIRTDDKDFADDGKSDDRIRGHYEAIQARGVVRNDGVDQVVLNADRLKRDLNSNLNLDDASNAVIEAQMEQERHRHGIKPKA